MNPIRIPRLGKRLRRTAIVVGAGGLLALGVACTPTTEVTVSPEGTAASGITVQGMGKVSVQPDIGMLNLGVEVTAPTVAEARDRAADAMTAMQDAMNNEGVENADIQTQYFNIYPQYNYPEAGTPQITGYIVSNQVQIKVRNLDSVSTVLDSAIAAGGDAVRVNGISFTVENPEEFLDEGRRAAVADARAHAETLADAAGVSLGNATSISESVNQGGPYPPVAMDMMAQESGGGRSTPVNPGEQELQVYVTVVFGINGGE